MRLGRRSLMVTCLATLLSATALGQQTQQKAKPETPPVAGAATIIGVSVTEVAIVAQGWSIKKQLLGKEVVNDKNEKLGKVDDIIVNPEKALSYAIIGVGGFLGIGKRDVAIPINQLKLEGDKFILPGASKEAIRSIPEFRYAK